MRSIESVKISDYLVGYETGEISDQIDSLREYIYDYFDPYRSASEIPERIMHPEFHYHGPLFKTSIWGIFIKVEEADRCLRLVKLICHNIVLKDVIDIVDQVSAIGGKSILGIIAYNFLAKQEYFICPESDNDH